MEAPNVIILDEPTNDLDIETLNVLEDYIEQFNGTVITVSHDRYFLDKISNEIIAFKGQGVIEKFTGNYTEYMEYAASNSLGEEKKVVKKEKAKNENKRERSNKPLKFSYKEKREYDNIEKWIEEVEMELEQLQDEINNCGSDYVLLQEFLQKQKESEEKLEEFMERWEYLSELAEKIENQ